MNWEQKVFAPRFSLLFSKNFKMAEVQLDFDLKFVFFP